MSSKQSAAWLKKKQKKIHDSKKVKNLKQKITTTFQKKREKLKDIRIVHWRKTSIIVGIFTTLLALAIGVYLFALKDLPSPKTLTGDSFPVSTQIFDRNGILLYEVYADQNRTPIKLEEVPQHVIQATIAIEDKDFYKHGGFAFRGVVRAAYVTLFKGELQGGSTITQQLVKTALLTPERTIQRKVRELLLSTATEIIYSKDEILEMYLNHIPYGGTAYGIEQAARLYFNKSAQDLTLAEGALLAGLPQAPSRYSPFGSTPDLARNRQLQVLQRMVEDGYITPDQMEAARNERLPFAHQSIDIKAPHFVMYVKDLLVEKYGQHTVEQGGLRVTTTLDLPLQEYAQASVSAEIDTLEKYNVTNGAALVTKPSTGEILAMIGSRDYFDIENDGNVNLTTRLRQPGSSIKPLNYALGLYKGYTAATIFLDIPTCFTATGQPQMYCPKNYDGGFHGVQNMRSSLANSYNIPAVKMLALNGVEDFIATASAMGITTWKDPKNYGLSLTLGGGEVRMVDMATAFGTLANSGIRIDLNPILKVENYRGEVLELNDHDNSPPAGKRVLPPEVTFIISDILSDNGARTPAFGAFSKLVIPGKTVSVKTGTTDDLRDNWTIGYTPEYVVSVWVGNNDNSKMNPYLVSGVTGAAPIWNDIMSYLLKDREDVIPPKPENVIGMSVCSSSNPQDPSQCQGRFEYFIQGTEKNQLHGSFAKKTFHIDTSDNKPPEEGETEHIEPQEKMMATDSFTIDYCVDCSHEGDKARIINLDTFYAERARRMQFEAKNNSIN